MTLQQSYIQYFLLVNPREQRKSAKPLWSSMQFSAGNAPAISLVLPVYNGERFLREALDSIFAQSFTDFELIAVDDCSTDETPQILADYAARFPQMRVHTNAVNSKLPASLNNGFRLARGAYFSWTSDDNIMRPNMLERLLVTALENPDCGIIHSDFTLIDEDGTFGRICARRSRR